MVGTDVFEVTADDEVWPCAFHGLKDGEEPDSEDWEPLDLVEEDEDAGAQGQSRDAGKDGL